MNERPSLVKLTVVSLAPYHSRGTHRQQQTGNEDEAGETLHLGTLAWERASEGAGMSCHCARPVASGTTPA